MKKTNKKKKPKETTGVWEWRRNEYGHV